MRAASRMIIKICGLTTIADALAAAEAGADMIGLNFYIRSPRFVSTETASKIAAALPGRICKVGLFVEEPARSVRKIAELLGLDAVQLHGSYPRGIAGKLPRFTLIRAFHVAAEEDLDQLEAAEADYFLLDGLAAGLHGGTGRRCDWSLASKAKDYGRIILAGGLTPGNVAEAVREVRPDGVDVASGVESAPGRKDIELMRRFVEAARAAAG